MAAIPKLWELLKPEVPIPRDWLYKAVVTFRHTRAIEIEVARSFYLRRELEGDYYWDVHLLTPEAAHLLEVLPRAQQGLAKLACKRIDCVVLTPDATWILEFKQRLRPSGIGELLMYRDLWRQQFRAWKSLRLGYVASVDDPALHATLRRHRIRLWIAP